MAKKPNAPNDNMAFMGGRPGSSAPKAAKPEETKKVEVEGFQLGDLSWIEPHKLRPNEDNPYPALTADQLEDLVNDMIKNGQLVPSIAYRDSKTLICGHNRREAALEALKRGATTVEKIPVQYIEDGSLTPEQEKALMESENERRRGGKWAKERKLEWIQGHFLEKIKKAQHGGDRKSQDQSSVNLAQEVAKKSKGDITEGTAKRLIAEIRKGLDAKPELTPYQQWEKEFLALLRAADKLPAKDQKRVKTLLEDRANGWFPGGAKK